MILADKIIKLRKQLGWSQEELAEKMGVSRQSVSKWESTQSIPDLNKILNMAEIFGVSTDFLLKDELEAAEFTEGDKGTNTRQIGLEQSLEYVSTKLAMAGLIVKGVALCVCSPTPLIFLFAMQAAGQFNLSSGMVAAFGIVALLIMVSIAISFFVRLNQHQVDIASIENNRFELSYGVHSVLTEKRQYFQPAYNRKLSFGIALFIGSIVPFMLVAILSGSPDKTLLMLVVMFLMITAGLFMVIPASAQLEAYDLLLSEGDRDAGKSEHTKNAEKLAAFYWPLLIAIYLGWSLWTMNWDITWIVFPVGAVTFAALVGLMGLLKKDDSRQAG
ncbi:helix-turn-helix transcriptional regulator [Porticoccus sp. W117]|uniref:helix-turn-helix domain-containing protein n=1 Tax=Porticoccus sp. W117 TaxID=3054777 RepID=UPI002597D5A9|nr:helix-turn-helix transcriptional regulator [Porticoccus sp. W117]MDM3870139.1 helix-turn-helix transcriptional regulator [Porticoccus sp. W117]